MIAEKLSNRNLIIATLMMLLFNCQHAFGKCPHAENGPRLDLTLPNGCLIRELIAKQMANPDEKWMPSAEAPADAERRIKAISTWRSENAKKMNAEDVKK